MDIQHAVSVLPSLQFPRIPRKRIGLYEHRFVRPSARHTFRKTLTHPAPCGEVAVCCRSVYGGCFQTSEEPLSQWAAAKSRPLTGFREHLGLHGEAAEKFKGLKRKISRTQAAKDAEIARMSTALDAVAEAWNRGKLRRGDRLDPHSHLRRKHQPGSAKLHSRAWTSEGCISLAFHMIGHLVPGVSRETHRELDAIGVVSLAARDHQAEVCGAVFGPAERIVSWSLGQPSIAVAPLEREMRQCKVLLKLM